MRLNEQIVLLVLLAACDGDSKQDGGGTAEELTCHRFGYAGPQRLAQKKICDGEIDCLDGEDERECPDHFVCPDELGGMSLKVVTYDKRCDDVLDCRGSGEDEEDCGRDFQLLCAGYDYFDLALEDDICDGKITCYYGDDEQDCADTHFCHTFGQVGPSAVIKPVQVCDGTWDCDDDEFNCPEIETFTCGLNQGRIPLANKCDGKAHCADRSDEQDCR